MDDAPHRSKLRIAVLFGGRSAEHDVSVLSATNVMGALDPAKYDAMPVFVTREGKWLLSSFEDGALAKPERGTEICLVPGGQGRIIALPAGGAAHDLPKIDILFPVLHGLHGEDGAAQGLCEVARVPLAGCGILGSATALDKDIAKRLLNEAGLATARSVTIRQASPPAFAEIEHELGLPIFIKPARQGSSVGVSKVATEGEFEAALAEGFKHDRKLLAEEFIRGREIECSVLEDLHGGLFVSRPGEIVPAESHGFYSYDAKYVDENGAALDVPAELPPEIESTVREMAGNAFRAVGCDAMARVDFFVTADMRILVNELNTIPGFTNISMYAKAMAASGVSYPEVIDRLVQHGLARAGR
ncbi:D-alanine--D-alanine ligase family protein [Mesorhizobium sp. CN2-181]|uniref:D-alanine--D-alanine ligase family protein n=1 Tax=Mesorhizobium yinganensis TaxID=3157707 RepID=UPI0032B7D38A